MTPFPPGRRRPEMATAIPDRTSRALISREGLARRLRMIRADHHLTLSEVERRAGITDSKLSRWERGNDAKYPDPAELEKLREIYGLGAGELLDADFEVSRVKRDGQRRMLHP